MNGRELGCKTLGCVTAMLVVLFFFYGMLVATEQAARKIKAKRSIQKTQNAMQNLQQAAIVIDGYAATNGGTLPPMDTAESLRAALVPKYIKDTSVLVDPRDGKPFQPNPALSGKSQLPFRNRAAVIYELAEVNPAPDGRRFVLFLSGSVRTVTAAEWATLSQKK